MSFRYLRDRRKLRFMGGAGGCTEVHLSGSNALGMLSFHIRDNMRSFVRCWGWREEGWSYREIAAVLNEAGVQTKAGGQRWHPTTVRKVLLNDLHAGLPKAA